jgi:hypothetical protein
MSDPNPPLPPYPLHSAAAPLGPIPMTFGQILDRIFRLMRSHLKPFLAISVLPIAFIIAFEAAFFGVLALAGVFHRPAPQQYSPAMLWAVVPIYIAFLPVMILVYGTYYGASTFAALEADTGTHVTALEAIRHAWSRVGRYTWLIVLKGLIVALPILVCVLAVVIGSLLFGLVPAVTSNTNASAAALFLLIPLAILLYTGAIVYAIIMSLRLSLAFPACVHENITAMQAIKRSGLLTSGAKGRIFLVELVIYAISYAFVFVLYIVGIIAIGALAGVGHIDPVSPLAICLYVIGGILALVLIFLWSGALMAAYTTSFAVFYRDQCLRKDGALAAPMQ